MAGVRIMDTMEFQEIERLNDINLSIRHIQSAPRT